MTDFLATPQSGLPGIGDPMEGRVQLAVICDLFGVTDRAVQYWVKKGYIPESIHGMYDLKGTIRGLYEAQIAIINKKQGPGGEEKNDLSRQRLAGQVRQLQLENDKLSGKLRDADKVTRVAFSRAKQINDMMETAPSRLKSILAAEADEFKVGQILKEEFDRIRSENISMVKSQW